MAQTDATVRCRIRCAAVADIAALCSAIARWIPTPQRTAPKTLANSISRPSPVVLAMRPRWSERVFFVLAHQPRIATSAARITARRRSTGCFMASLSWDQSIFAMRLAA